MYDPGAERDVWSRPRSKGDDFELSALHPAFIGERKIEKEGKIVDRGGEEKKKGGGGGCVSTSGSERTASGVVVPG